MKKKKTFSEWSYGHRVAYVIAIVIVCVSILVSTISLIVALTSNLPDDGAILTIYSTSIASFILSLLSLIYKIPMIKAIEASGSNDKELSLTFKILTLIFLTSIGGILLLISKDLEMTSKDESTKEADSKFAEVDKLLADGVITEEEAKKLKGEIVKKAYND